MDLLPIQVTKPTGSPFTPVAADGGDQGFSELIDGLLAALAPVGSGSTGGEHDISGEDDHEMEGDAPGVDEMIEPQTTQLAVAAPALLDVPVIPRSNVAEPSQPPASVAAGEVGASLDVPPTTQQEVLLESGAATVVAGIGSSTDGDPEPAPVLPATPPDGATSEHTGDTPARPENSNVETVPALGPRGFSEADPSRIDADELSDVEVAGTTVPETSKTTEIPEAGSQRRPETPEAKTMVHLETPETHHDLATGESTPEPVDSAALIERLVEWAERAESGKQTDSISLRLADADGEMMVRLAVREGRLELNVTRPGGENLSWLTEQFGDALAERGFEMADREGREQPGDEPKGRLPRGHQTPKPRPHQRDGILI